MRDGTAIDLGGTRAETLLALLAIQPGSPVSADALIDELWAGEPPEGAPTTLRSYVSRLRTALGDAAPIERVGGGYLLGVDPESIDVVRFERGVREGRELQSRGRHRRAAGALRTALETWRGEPFAGLLRDGFLHAEAGRLEELRLSGLEARLESDLELGKDSELIDELESLVARHPFREPMWRQLMLALYRAGRQADALDAYHRARGALDDELGIEPGEELRDLEAAILRQAVPAPAAVPPPSAIGLPASVTGFVGRGREMDDVRAMLLRSRLVTLVGVGGVGKTRLALEVARRAASELVDEVAIADLSPITDPSVVKAHVAAALGIREDAGDDLDRALERRLRAGDVLLVLDNCEHVLEASAELAHDVLRASPELRILATSREVLDIPGEATYPVPALGLPEAADGPEEAGRSEAVRLLVERAALARHDFAVDDAALDTAARIVRDLEGLPLAIELAAARAKVLSLAEIADRLQNRFEVLVSRQRLTTARHRTLREAMDWSFELLGPDEQRLLAQVSVFPGGATLASIAVVCLGADLATAERLVERLVDTSLAMPIETGRGTRYRLLETVREYAAEQVPEAERDDLRRRHAERARELAEWTNLSLEGVGQNMDFELVRDELASIRAALRWAQDADPALGLQIACALERFWVTNQPREGLAIFDALLDQAALPDVLRARAFRCRGGCRYILGDFLGGTSDYERSLAIFRGLDRPADEAHLLMRLAIEAKRTGDLDRAKALFDEAAARGGGDRYPPDGWLGAIFEGELAFELGRQEEALDHLERGAALAADAHDRWWHGDILIQLAEYALEIGRVEEGGRAARDGLAQARDVGVRPSMIWAVALLAREAAAKGQARRAGRLWGGLETEVERNVVGQWEDQHDAVRAQVASVAGPGFHGGITEGRLLTFDAVIAEALSPA